MVSRKDFAATDWAHGCVIAVLGLKGEVGKTTIADRLRSNLSFFAKVWTIDLNPLNLDGPQAAFTLNKKNIGDVLDLLENSPEIDLTKVYEVVHGDTAGAAPGHDVALEITPVQMKMLIDVLSLWFDYIVIDTPAGSDRIDAGLICSAAELADVRIAVTTPTRESLKQASRLFTMINPDLLVLNRTSRRSRITPEKVAEVLQREVSVAIPEDPNEFDAKALRARFINYLEHPETSEPHRPSPAEISLTALANQVTKRHPRDAAKAIREKNVGNLANLFRKKYHPPKSAKPSPPKQARTLQEEVIAAALSPFIRPKTKYLVISDHSTMERKPDENTFEFINQEGPILQRDTFDSFVAADRQAEPLRSDMSLGIPYVLLSGDGFHEIAVLGGWELYYNLYPAAYGLLDTSGIGVNSAGDQALMYVGQYHNELAGRGDYVILEKKEGNWTIQQTIMTWIS